MFKLLQSQAQMINFVLVDAVGSEVTGLGNTFTINVSKAGMNFLPGAGLKSEIGMGWYSYVLTANETNTVGPLIISITSPGTVQQNLEYVVESRAINSVEFSYTVTNTSTLQPIEDVRVWITIDAVGSGVIWEGDTDAFGVARGLFNNLPRLDPGTYFFWCEKPGFTFNNPDQEVVS